VERAIAQLAAAEGRLLSIRDELFGRAWQLGKLLPAIKERVGHGKWMIWLPDGNSGRRARLRIPKSSISKRFFSFQKMIDLRAKNAIFHDRRHVYDRRVKRRHSSTNSSTTTSADRAAAQVFGSGTRPALYSPVEMFKSQQKRCRHQRKNQAPPQVQKSKECVLAESSLRKSCWL
jgi:hypothetical protein